MSGHFFFASGEVEQGSERDTLLPESYRYRAPAPPSSISSMASSHRNSTLMTIGDMAGEDGYAVGGYRGVGGRPTTTTHDVDQNNNNSELEAAHPSRIWACFLVTIPIFMGYGTLIKLQSNLRVHLWVANGAEDGNGTFLPQDGHEAYLFGLCVSFYYFGLFVFRIGHNIFFGFRSPHVNAALSADGVGGLGPAANAIDNVEGNVTSLSSTPSRKASSSLLPKLGSGVRPRPSRPSNEPAGWWESEDAPHPGINDEMSSEHKPSVLSTTAENNTYNSAEGTDSTSCLTRVCRAFYLTPPGRVVVACLAMGAANLLIALFFHVLFPYRSIIGITATAKDVQNNVGITAAVVLLLYFLGGAAVATFEPNVMASITPLGRKNKSLAAVGIPFGTNSVTLVVLVALGFGGPPQFLPSTTIPGNTTTTSTTASPSLGSPVSSAHQKEFNEEFRSYTGYVELGGYCASGALCFVAAAIFWCYIPRADSLRQHDDVHQFIHKLKNVRDKGWLYGIRFPLVVSFFDQICLAMSVSIAQYMYGSKNGVPMLYPFLSKNSTDDANHQYAISHNYFLTAYFVSAFFGAVLARHFTFFTRRRINPQWYLLGVVFPGIAMVLSTVPLVALIGIFLIMYGNGAVYASSIRIIDETVSLECNLVALSVWMALGDIGGFIGANCVVPVHTLLGTIG